MLTPLRRCSPCGSHYLSVAPLWPWWGVFQIQYFSGFQLCYIITVPFRVLSSQACDLTCFTTWNSMFYPEQDASVFLLNLFSHQVPSTSILCKCRCFFKAVFQVKLWCVESMIASHSTVFRRAYLALRIKYLFKVRVLVLRADDKPYLMLVCAPFKVVGSHRFRFIPVVLTVMAEDWLWQSLFTELCSVVWLVLVH